MSLEVLGHAEGADLLLAKDRLHLLVGLEELLVLGVLELLLLDVGPELLHHLGSAELVALLDRQQIRELVAERERFRESASLRHFPRLLVI